MTQKKNNPKDLRKKICKPGLLHMVFLPQLFRKKLGVFDFVSSSGPHCYVSCLMSMLPEFKTHSVPRSCCWIERGEGKGQGYELETLVGNEGSVLNSPCDLGRATEPQFPPTLLSPGPGRTGWKNACKALSCEPHTLAAAFPGSRQQNRPTAV